MIANMGTIDRVLRAIIGLVLLGLAATSILPAWAYIGVVPLITAVFAVCPLYRLLGVNTCAK